MTAVSCSRWQTNVLDIMDVPAFVLVLSLIFTWSSYIVLPSLIIIHIWPYILSIQIGIFHQLVVFECFGFGRSFEFRLGYLILGSEVFFAVLHQSYLFCEKGSC